MYDYQSGRLPVGRVAPALVAAIIVLGATSATSPALAQMPTAPGIITKLENARERIELTVNSSRILTLDKKIPRVIVNNPEVVSVNPVSPNQVQLAGVASGVTQVNMLDEEENVYTIDVVVYGDVKELDMLLKTLYPRAAVRAVRTSNTLVLTGYVDNPDHVSKIRLIAEDYAPKVINSISVGGVQQVLMKTQVAEVSRTKLRQMGFDFAQFSNGNGVISSVSGIIQASLASPGVAVGSGGETVSFGVVDGSDSFFGFLQALEQYDLMKVLATPELTAVSGRPASFNVGGEFPILVPQSLGTVSIEFKKFGTQVDMVPIVLGNGNIRLEVRPRVSEIDNTRAITINDITVPGLRVREVDTAVEMRAGQTLALAGLIQRRVEAQNRKLPYVGDAPWIGAAFRSVQEEVNEIELLILVTPYLVDGMDPHEVPSCLPGGFTQSPSRTELYWKGFLEVPACECQDPAHPAQSGTRGYPGVPAGHLHGTYHGPHGPTLPGYMGDAEEVEPQPETSRKSVRQAPPMPKKHASPEPSKTPQVQQTPPMPKVRKPAKDGGEQTLRLPPEPEPQAPPAETPTESRYFPEQRGPQMRPTAQQSSRRQAGPIVTPRVSRSATAEPVLQLPNRYESYNRTTEVQGQPATAGPATGESPGFIGATGYDVLR